MMTVVGLTEALAFTSGLLLCFAFLRRIMRSPTPPKFLDNTIAGFGMALILTVVFMMSLMFMGFSLFPVIGSVALSAVTAMAAHLIIWTVMRLLVPLHEQANVVGHSILDRNPLAGGSLPAH